MTRYSIDFQLWFTVPSDDPNPNNISAEAIIDALQNRLNELRSIDPEGVASEVWPPEIFDHGEAT